MFRKLNGMLVKQTRHLKSGWTSVAAREYGLQAVAPRRSLLYIPGNDRRKIAKLKSLNSDFAVLDCEDGVAENKKEDARNTIKEVYSTLIGSRTEVAVRINAVGTGHEEKDMDAVLAARPTCVLLPKVDSVEHVKWVFNYLGKDSSYKPSLILYVESAVSLLQLPPICQIATQKSEEGNAKVEGLVFGSDDFLANIGAERTADAQELTYARQKIVAVAKAFRLQAIDMVHIDYSDTKGLRRQAREGARMGFTGKQVIHPAQVPVVQEAFTPTQEKVEWAAALVTAFEQHQSSGKGAFTFRGSMIDMPLLLQAKNILAMSKS